MIFECGETQDAREKRLRDWHPFFALWPRTIEEKDGRKICAWLQWIERRALWQDYVFGWTWQYREKQK